MSAELKAARDREFADQLQRRLAEKTGTGGSGAKVEPIFKTTSSPKPAAAPVARPRPEPESKREREAKPQTPQPNAPKFRDIRIDGVQDPIAPKPAEPTAARVVPMAANHQPMPAVQPLPALPLVMRAALFAADRHKSQRRRGAAREPYINHLLEVASLLATATDGRDPDLVTAGVLHDLIEDQGVGADDIARQFGVGIAALVLEVTSDKTLPEDERNRAQILHAAHKSPRARMLRIADLTSNLRALRQSPPADWSVERQREYFRWAHEVVARSRGLSAPLETAFDEAFGAGPPGPDHPASPHGSL